MENNSEAPHHRREDDYPMERIWRRVRPYWHIATTILVAVCTAGVGVVVWVTAVNALPGKVDALDLRVSAVEEKVGKIDVVRQRVDDIADFMGAPRYKRNHDNVEKN